MREWLPKQHDALKEFFNNEVSHIVVVSYHILSCMAVSGCHSVVAITLLHMAITESVLHTDEHAGGRLGLGGR
jgi:hypothetical protein